MITIDNYINERLNPRHLGPSGRFPIGGTLDKMIEFLEDNEFKPLGGDTNISIINKVDKLHGRYFHFYKMNGDYACLSFADTSKHSISKDNQVYVIAVSEYDSNIYWKYYNNVSSNIPQLTEVEFLEEINNRFGWI
jgi:hypothetical protein